MADHRYFFATAYDKRFKEFYSLPDEKLFHLDVGFLTFDKTQASRLSPLPEDVARYISRPGAWDATNTYFSSLVTGWYRSFRYGKYGLHTTQYVGAYEDSSGYNGFLQSGYHADLQLQNKKRTYLELHLEYWNVSGDPPAQFLRHLSRVPAAEQFVRSRIFRSPGTFPTDWQDDFYLAGHDVRGYQDRLVYFTDAWTASLALTPPDLIPYRWFGRVPLIGTFLSKADQSFFLDAAAITMDGKEDRYRFPISQNETRGEDWSYYLSAGVSINFPPVWRDQKFRLDFPLYLNKPAPGDHKFKFRFSVAWLLPGVFE